MSKLGKGLSALIPDKKENVYNKQQGIKLNVSDISSGKFQHRKNFDNSTLLELAESIKSNGVIQPIIVRKKNNLDGYEIIAGERRWRASKSLGLSEIPAIVVEVCDKKALEMSIIENVQRDDFNIIEEAQGYKNLIDEFGYIQEDLVKIVGKSRSHIANCIRILSLSDDIKDFIVQGRLSMGHARALVGIKNAVEIAKTIIDKSLSVRQTEALIKSTKKNVKNKEKNEDIVLLEKTMFDKTGLNLKININDNKKNGSIVMPFNNFEELRAILDKFKHLIKK